MEEGAKGLPRSTLNPAARTAHAGDALAVRVSCGALLGEMTQVVARQQRGRCQMADVADVGLRLVLRVAPGTGTLRLVQGGAVLEVEVVRFHFTLHGTNMRGLRGGLGENFVPQSDMQR